MAGTEIERLFVKIEGDISGLSTSMAKANSEVQRAQKSMDATLGKMGGAFVSAGKALAGAFGVASVGAAVAGLSRLQQGALALGSSVADAAIQAGFSTTAIQELTYASLQMGLSEEKLNTALQRLSVNIGRVRTEGAAAVPHFARLGVELTDVNGVARSNEVIFRDVIERLGGISDSASRAAESAGLFGREAGPKFAELIAAGTAGLDQYAKAAHDAGAILDEEFLAALKSTSDEITALDKQIAVNLANAFGTSTPIIKAWKEMVEGATGALAEWTQGASDFEAAAAVFNVANPHAVGGLTTAAVNYLRVLEEIRQISAGLPDRLAGNSPIPFANAPEAGPLGLGVPETPDEQKAREKADEVRKKALEKSNDDALKATQEHKEAMLEYERDYYEQLNALAADNVNAQLEYDEIIAENQKLLQQQRYEAARNALTDLSTLMASSSRKMFEVGKAAAIAQTVIDTYAAAQAAYKAMAGIPVVGPALGIAAAAAAVASGLARVQAIKSTNFGSRSVAVGVGNNVAVGSSSGGSGGGDSSGGGSNVYINLKGDSFSGDTVRDLIQRISEAQGDGARITVTS